MGGDEELLWCRDENDRRLVRRVRGSVDATICRVV